MKKQYFIILLLFPIMIHAQDVHQNVIGNSGDYYQNTQGSLTWTLGELMTQTFKNGDNTLTQGFNQSNLTVTSISKADFDFNIKVYPNPVTDILIIESDSQSLKYYLYNLIGEIISVGSLNNNREIVDFTSLPSGIYILQIGDVKTHKIIKQ